MIDGSQRPPAVLVELDEASRVDLTRLLLHRPDGRIRSPMLEPRSDARAPRRDYPPAGDLPPLRAFLGPLVWVLVPGLPVFVRVGWQAAVVMALVALMVREAHVRANRSTISFGEGFLGYSAREDWPHGVQEDDDVHWNWSTVRSAVPGRGAHA